MPDERLYSEDEVNQIIEAASTEPDARMQSAPTGNALTLRELQEIGREVGLNPERIADAARAIDSVPQGGNDSLLPITVRRTVTLPRAPTEAEWLVLVSELRETFDASGRVGDIKGIFQWSNGNLRAFIEPTGSGYRLRIGTRNSNLVALAAGGLVALALGAAAFAGMPLSRNFATTPMTGVVLAMFGTGAIGVALFRLSRWARTRAEQMEFIARRAQALLGSGD